MTLRLIVIAMLFFVLDEELTCGTARRKCRPSTAEKFPSAICWVGKDRMDLHYFASWVVTSTLDLHERQSKVPCYFRFRLFVLVGLTVVFHHSHENPPSPYEFVDLTQPRQGFITTSIHPPI